MRNRRVFDNAELLDLEFKSSFMCNFLEWVKGGLKDGSMSMVDFILSSCSLPCSALVCAVCTLCAFFSCLLICYFLSYI